MIRDKRLLISTSLGSILVLCVLIDPVAAQDEAAQEGQKEQPAANAETSSPDDADTAHAQQYEPAYFDRFAPRNALDMVSEIPGFSISGDDGDGGQRGLGQANANVLVNGERFSSKSDGVRDQLRRIPAKDVIRIEIIDGTALDIPGLSGQVANVIYENSGVSGQFRYNAGYRLHNSGPQYYGGEISLTGTSGNLDYTVALSNSNRRFGADGPTILTDARGDLIERQNIKFSGKFDNPKLSTNFSYDFGNEVMANLNLSYSEDFFSRDVPETGIPVNGPIRMRMDKVRENGPEYEISGDIAFPLGSGSLKLIGLERFERDNFNSEVIDSYDDLSPTTGSRFLQTNGFGERIGRFEYDWKMWEGDWQLSGEAAFNRLDRVSQLFELSAAGDFTQTSFPSGTGGVRESRYEAGVSYSRQLTNKLALQANLAGELSKLEQTGAATSSRSFQRPKGSLSLAWKPEKGLDFSLEVRRRVGQLSFGDFLANVSLNDDNQSAGNMDLVPNQSWVIELEANKSLGDWGSFTFNLRQSWFEDYIDYFPLDDGTEARGNIGDARRTHMALDATIKTDPIGWSGGQFDIKAIKRWMNVTDPFTGETRPFSTDLIDLLEIGYRHDIPGSNWAYGGDMSTTSHAPYSRLFETGRASEGPVFLGFFIEHKDVFGLTVNARARNALHARRKSERIVFEDARPFSAISFREVTSQRIGLIFRLSISGNF